MENIKAGPLISIIFFWAWVTDLNFKLLGSRPPQKRKPGKPVSLFEA